MDARTSIDVSIHAIAEPAARPRELAMCAAWHGGLVRTLRTVSGDSLEVVFHGHWSHGFGPDFSDAMVEFPGNSLRTGSVELHTRASDWVAHGHGQDPRYDDVILHVVSRLDLAETRTANGKSVPMVVLDVPDEALFAIDARLPSIWSELGGAVCAPHLAVGDQRRLRTIVQRLGDERLDRRSRTLESDLLVRRPVDILLGGLLDVFGYSENRNGMQALTAMLLQSGALPGIAMGALPDRIASLTSLMLGLSGFFPLAPADAELAGLLETERADLEVRWATMRPAMQGEPLSALTWTRARTRPANHPVPRLVSAATLVANLGVDPLAAVLNLVTDDPAPLATLQSWTMSPYGPGLGRPRTIAMLGNVVIPFALALARHDGNDDLEDSVSRLWSALPMSEWSRPARRALTQATGLSSVSRLGERGLQGLLQLDRTLCTPRRCYECPVAADVVRETTRRDGEASPLG